MRHGLLAACLALSATCVCAGSWDYCDSGTVPTAAVQDRLLQVAAITKSELDRSGSAVALISRSGLALQRLGQRYSHIGVSLKASPNTPWSVRQLYFSCDEQRPRIFDQGISGFVMGANDLNEGYVSIVLPPADAGVALELTALDGRTVLSLLANTYSANAYAFSQRYQNCNQWLAELLATAWGDLAAKAEEDPNGAATPRSTAQDWLQAQGYAPTVLHIVWQPLMWLAARLRWLHSDDHPTQDLDAAQFRVSMPKGIENFVRQRYPQATRIELCYTTQHVVVHRGWGAIATGCMPSAGDEVTALR